MGFSPSEFMYLCILGESPLGFASSSSKKSYCHNISLSTEEERPFSERELNIPGIKKVAERLAPKPVLERCSTGDITCEDDNDEDNEYIGKETFFYVYKLMSYIY